MLPVARSYWRQHGTFALLKRVVEVQFDRSKGGSAFYAGRWTRTDDRRLDVLGAPSTYLARGRVAVIGALDLDQCKKYRVLQKIEQLQETYDLQVMVSSYSDVQRGFDILQLATALVFYRVPYGEFFSEYLREARRLKIPVFYDVDDPIFAERVYKSNANLTTLTKEESAHLVGQCPLYLKAARSVDACIASTPQLQALLALHAKLPTYLWRNAIDSESESIAQSVASEPVSDPAALKIDSASITIGYMSGSRAHNLDFALIGKPLAAALDQHPAVRLLIKGHASLPQELFRFEDRVEFSEFSSYYDYFRTLNRCDIIVVPLLDDEFNACKSAIRYMEASLIGKPCIVSAVGDVVNLATHEAEILFANEGDEWDAGLQRLIESRAERHRIGSNAHDGVLRAYTSGEIAKGLDHGLVSALCGRDEN